MTIWVRRFASNSQFLRLGCALAGDIGGLGAVGAGPLGLGGLGKGKTARLRGMVELILKYNMQRDYYMRRDEAAAVR